MSVNPPTLGAEMQAALRHGFAVVREGMTNPDIRIALKANAEMAKLVALCSRLGIEVPTEDAAPTPTLTPTPVVQPEAARQKKAEVLTSVFSPRSSDQPVTLPAPPRAVPSAGKSLTSFLGSTKPTPPPIRSATSG
jgi:hypothetical protein